MPPLPMEEEVTSADEFVRVEVEEEEREVEDEGRREDGTSEGVETERGGEHGSVREGEMVEEREDFPGYPDNVEMEGD